ncbi:MAG: hypothetical protein D6706_21115, partial [Chloroflexi bacterium]
MKKTTKARRLFLIIFIAAIAITGVAIPWTIVRAVTCNVPSGYATIQAAINDSSCDTIIIAEGDYTENLVITRSVTIQGAGPGFSSGPGVTRILGDLSDRVVYVYTPSTPPGSPGVPTPVVNISDLSITRGSVSDRGGGVYNDSAVLTLNNVYLFENYATLDGDQLYGSGSAITTIQNSVLLSFPGGSGNSIKYSSGAVLGSLTIINSSLEGAGLGSTPRYAIFTTRSPVLLQNSDIYGFDGGIYVNTGAITVENSTIRDNYFTGIAFFNGSTGAISGSQILRHGVTGGSQSAAGISMVGSVTVTVDTTTIANNWALDSSSQGNGIEMVDYLGNLGVITVTNSTLRQNADSGFYAEVSVNGAPNSGDITLMNTEVYSNGAGLSLLSIAENGGNATTILDSNIYGNNGQGVQISQYGKRLLIERSDIRENGNYGISIDMVPQAEWARIRDTTIAYNGGSGLYLSD